MDRYVPAHHPLCSCALCDLARHADPRSPVVRSAALVWMESHGKACTSQTTRADREARDGALLGGIGAGKRVRWQWAHRTPDLALNKAADRWNRTHEAIVIAVGNGAALLQADEGRPRWWPLRAFAWIEVLEPGDTP